MNQQVPKQRKKVKERSQDDEGSSGDACLSSDPSLSMYLIRRYSWLTEDMSQRMKLESH